MSRRPAILVRKCQTLDEIRACVALQKEVWAFADIELVPLRIFVVAQKIGGQVIGAFINNELVGFAMAIPAVRNRHSFLYSHMLAVRKQYRNFGVGRSLKLFQRDEALGRGFELMEWTFDPLEIKNAYLNIEKLGAIVRRYNVNQYGITSSPLQGGLPTDRLVAEWWLKSKRVENVLKERARAPFTPEATISVPAQIYDWKSKPETRNRALQLQDHNRAEFLEAFAKGLAVLGYEGDQQGNGTFLLGRWDEKWNYPFS
ncbi:MAG TPA: GNAT family N-acetyltransferase [Terriglobales bacterium]|nr:GNAT family N-acetyltransferase [Terriglobales bacterium]